MNAGRQLALSGIVLALVACSSAPRVPISPPATPATNQPSANPSSSSGARLPALPPAGSGRGGYYQDDGPGDHPPEGLLDVPDAVPKVEPYSTTGNKPYVVFGKTYTPILDQRPFKQRGTGSWYGKKFHGQKTSSGELYDMYKLTAAHPTLP
ncbi:MAG TPA: septal ring lytic transglycosylase RlpA family protein, partial [Burkholderiaceae bacterium]|nr:septal ring lytic transglycosylase RlpA family protein [Burkholderiaceae bacterium]